MGKTATCHAKYIKSSSPKSVEFTIECRSEKHAIFISSQSIFLSNPEEALLSAIFFPCLMNKMTYVNGDTISQTFKAGLRDIYKTMRGWGMAKCSGGWSDINARNDREPQGHRIGSFFTGGVDSFYTLLKHRNEITDLIYVHGFDVPLSDENIGRIVSEKLRQTAAKFGKNLIELKTNLRDFFNKQMNWGMGHGPALATIAHSLSGEFNKILIPSSFVHDELFPWGSHPDIDPKWSSDQVKLVHAGCDANRLGKIKLIAENDFALKTLRVCWENRNGAYNCGKCEKCTRTLLGLRAAGIRDSAISFASPLDIEKVRQLPLTKKASRIFAAQNLLAFKEMGNEPEIVDALQYAFKQIDKWGSLKESIRQERRRRVNQFHCLLSR